jgi:hypothetical protein
MPPVFALALALMGTAVLVRWCVREVQRVNAELDEVRERATVEPVQSRGAADVAARPRYGRVPAGLNS